MISLGAVPITLSDVKRVAFREALVSISSEAIMDIKAARKLVDEIAASDKPVYGINTGFGALAETAVGRADRAELQRNLILSHCAGVGDPLSAEETRALMLLRLNVLCRGRSGVRVEVAETLKNMLNEDILPLIPEKGSVGASGDLAPLAHLALGIIGEGECLYRGKKMKSGEALRKAGIKPVVLQAKEGLALINGTQAITAVGALALGKAEGLASIADVAVAVTVEAIKGTARPFEERIHKLRPHRGQAISASNIRKLLRYSQIAKSHINCQRVQDPYSLRCAPQVHGAARETIMHCSEILQCEVMSCTDNPLVFHEEGEVVSGGNFHGEPLALALDYMAMGIANLGAISERRTDVMMTPSLSGLPPFLAAEPGLNSGFMIAQVTAAALVAENRHLANPVSTDSLPTSAGKEDYVSMGMTSALKLRPLLRNLSYILGIELLCGAQGIEFHKPFKASKGAVLACSVIREKVAPMKRDRYLADDIAAVSELVYSGELLKNLIAVGFRLV